MKKLLIYLILLLSWAGSLLVYPELPEKLPSQFGTGDGSPSQFEDTKWLIFLHPFMMLIITLQLIVLPKQKKLQDFYARYKKGTESIFLALILLLAVLHLFMILIGLGYNLNMHLILPLGVGLLFIITGNTLPRFKFVNQADQTIRSFSNAIVVGGFLMLPCVFLPSPWRLVAFLTVLILTVLAALTLLSYRFFQQNKST